MASLAVGLSWWSYCSNLSNKSSTSSEIYFLFSSVINLLQGACLYLTGHEYPVYRKKRRNNLRSHNFLYTWIQCQIVFLEVHVQFLCTEYFGNLDQLIIIITTTKEGILAKYLMYNGWANQFLIVLNILFTMPASIQPKLHKSKL